MRHSPAARRARRCITSDTATDALHFAPGAFNAPTISQVGSLGVAGNVIGANGFEIDAMGMGWAALTLDNGDSGLYSINLMTGLATFNGALNANLRGLTSAPFMAPVPEPETYAMLLAGLGLIGAAARAAASLARKRRCGDMKSTSVSRQHTAERRETGKHIAGRSNTTTRSDLSRHCVPGRFRPGHAMTCT